MKNKIYSIEEAIEQIDEISKAIEKPVLVGVFSAGQNVGKTYFCYKAIEYFQKKISKEEGRLSIYASCSHNEDYFFNSTIKTNYDDIEFLFFHCGINSYQPDKSEIEYWNKEMEKVMKRYKTQGFKKKIKTKLDIAVVIYNPKVFLPNLHTLVEDFDIVIKNEY